MTRRAPIASVARRALAGRLSAFLTPFTPVPPAAGSGARLRVQSGDQTIQIDNVQFNGAVPEPLTLALLAAGLAVSGLARRR